MMRGTFANVRIKNLMLPPRADGTREEGGVTLFQPSGEKMLDLRRRDALHRARHADGRLRRRGVRHRIVARLGGEGHAAARRAGGDREELRAHPSRRTWSAWACCRCQFKGSDTVASLGINGDETFDITGTEADIKPQMDVTLDDPPQGRHVAATCRCCCASTRRSRSTTTRTAASCRSCCANWSAAVEGRR
mgnify:CR=1 FL=1